YFFGTTNGRRNPFDFVSSKYLTNLTNVVAVASTDLTQTIVKTKLLDSGFAVYFSGSHYLNSSARLKSLTYTRSNGSFVVHYSLNKEASKDFKDELQVRFFGHNSDSYLDLNLRHDKAVYNFAPRSSVGIVVDSLKLKKGSNNAVRVSARGGGTGALFGNFYVNGKKCPKRISLVFLDGFATRLSPNVSGIDGRRVDFRLHLPEGRTLRSGFGGRKKFAKLSQNEHRKVCGKLSR
ncbi:MAG: hypothetical protein NZO16_04645, partial [Deltaproteobacteria bacterium]|nr:hypothetical protein [Deltaproteobacteria bacterium]